MSEVLNNQDSKETLKKQSFICACSEGEERSVFAEKLLNKLGIISTYVLPSGLEGLTEYFNGEGNTDKIERMINRGISNAFIASSFRERQNRAEYKKLLRKNATWLLFLDKNSEAKYFRNTINELINLGLDVIILHSWDEESVTKEINKYLKNI